MSTITAKLTASPDGTLHLPLPAGWTHQTVRVTAELEPVGDEPAAMVGADRLKGYGCLQGKVWMAADFDAPLDDFDDYTK